MTLYEAFGVGKLKISGSVQHVEDRVVPTDACGDTTALFKRLGDHPTVPEFLSRPPFDKKALVFSRTPDIFPSPIERVFFQATVLMACEATWEGVPHYFLGQRLRRLLRTSDLSVVRNRGQWCHVFLDTQTSPYEFHAQPLKMTDLVEFYEDFQGYDLWGPGFLTDYVTPRGGLSIYPASEFEPILIGSLEQAVPVWQYFLNLGGRESNPPLKDGVMWSPVITLENRFACARRDTGHGFQIFLTREAYRHLEGQKMAIVRATRQPPHPHPKRLSLIWTGPNEVAP